MRKKIAAGNWKMNTSILEGVQLTSEILNMVKDEVISDVQVILAVPFTHLTSISAQIKETKNFHLSAQNCSNEASGAFTGEISIDMISSTGASHVVVGHSERREYFGESDELILKKMKAALSNRISPIYCCGEKLSSRESGKHFDVVKQQVSESILNLSSEEILETIVAYEPVWAIGTGKTASAEQAQEMHAFIRSLLQEQFGKDIANQVSILYGGSVKPSNAKEIFEGKDVDGGLVGGASLKSRDFVEIIKAL